MITHTGKYSVAKILLGCAALVLFIVFSALSFKSRHTMAAWYANASFYLVFTLFLLWAAQIGIYLRQVRFSAATFIRTYWIGLLAALLTCAVIFYSVPVYLKILNDETNLLAVSQSMFYYQDANRISMAKFFHNGFQAIHFEVPIRPLMFPFVTYLFHAILGYSHENVFILNFLVMFAFLAGVYVCARQFTATPAAIAAILFVAAYPVFSIYGTSGGYDLFSSFCFYLVMILVYQYLQSPTPSGFALLWTTLLMLANIRSESVIFFPVVIIAVIAASRRHFFKQCAHLYLLTPLLFLPYIWQRVLSVGEYENPEYVPLFSLDSFLDHLWIMIENFFNLNLYLPYAGLLNLVALLVFLYLAGQLALRRIALTPPLPAFWGILGLCLCLHTMIVLSHFMGLYDGPSQARFFLNISVACGLSPILFAAVYPQKLSGRILLFSALLVFVFYHPIAVGHEFVNKMLASRSHTQETRFLKNLNDPDILILSSYCSQFSALHYSAVSIAYANRHRNALRDEMGKGLYSRIIAFQHIDSRSGNPVSKLQKLDPAFIVTPVKSISIFPNLVLRISEIGFNP